MFIKLLKKVSLILLALNFIACSALAPGAPKPAAADIEKEEEAVYSFFASGGEGVALILQDTTSEISTDNPKQSTDYIKSGLKSISKATLNSFLARNAQPSQLSADMHLGIDYTLLSADELAKIASQPNWEQLLTEQYPNSHGYFIFSRVGFNNSLDQAVIYVGQVDGPLMGAGYYYLMEKKNGEWVIKEQLSVWIA